MSLTREQIAERLGIGDTAGDSIIIDAVLAWLAEERDIIEATNDRRQKQNLALVERMKEIENERDALAAENRRLREAFAEYGGHRRTCYAYDPGSHWDDQMTRSQCDCGYVQAAEGIAAALAAPREGET